MPQEHLDRLSAVDASFLVQEGSESHMHVGALVTLEGPPPDMEDFLDSLRGRLHLVPRYRQKLAFPPAGTGRPLWVDDTDFNLEYHVRHTALPRPGSDEQLRNLVARIFSQQLDRSKPLWELWLVEGIEDGSWAMITKTPPRAHRRHLRRRPRDGAVRPRLRCRARSSIPTAAGSRTASPPSVDLLAGVARAMVRTGLQVAERRRRVGRAARARRSTPRARRPRASARSSGRRSTRRRRRR